MTSYSKKCLGKYKFWNIMKPLKGGRSYANMGRSYTNMGKRPRQTNKANCIKTYILIYYIKTYIHMYICSIYTYILHKDIYTHKYMGTKKIKDTYTYGFVPFKNVDICFYV